MPNVPLPHGSEWNDIRGAVLEVQDCRKRKSRDEQMRNLFAKLSAAATGSQLQSDYLAFQYDGRTVAEIRLPLVFCDQQSTQDPAWAYLDGTWSSEQRYNFHSRRKRSFSYATRAVQDVKDLPLDPLYVAILIALAQKSRGARPPRASKTSQKVSLFVPEHTAGTSSTDKQSNSSRTPQALVTSLKQYTATITDEYLQKFDDPYHFHDSALHIHQESFRIGLPSTMFQAIQEASRAQNLSLVPSTIRSRRMGTRDEVEQRRTSSIQGSRRSHLVQGHGNRRTVLQTQALDVPDQRWIFPRSEGLPRCFRMRVPYEVPCYQDISIDEGGIYGPRVGTFSEGSVTSTQPPGGNSRGGGGSGSTASTAAPPTSTAPPTPTAIAFWTPTAMLAISLRTRNVRGSPNVCEYQWETHDAPTTIPYSYDSCNFKNALYTSIFDSRLPKPRFSLLSVNSIRRMGISAETSLRARMVVDRPLTYVTDSADISPRQNAILNAVVFVNGLNEAHVGLIAGTRDHVLDEVALEDVPNTKDDISTFLRDELSKTRKDEKELGLIWPGPEVIEELARMAEPLFIFAATICRFIQDELKPGVKARPGISPCIYTATSTPGASQATKLTSEFREVVGIVALLAEPLPAPALINFLTILAEVLNLRLGYLHSVLSIPDSKELPVKMFHLSFREFLLDCDKQHKYWFWVDEKEAHGRIALRCLEIMSSQTSLKHYLCDMKGPGVARSKVGWEVVHDHLAAQVRYACQYWVYHMEKSEGHFRDVHAVLVFLQTHLLHWFEALSWMGRISEGVTMIVALRSLFDTYKNSELTDFLYDAYQFLLSYRSIADSSPLQLCSSALIFAPKASLIRNTFQNCTPSWISQQPEVESDWNAVQQTLEGHGDRVTSVAFSHDSTLLASASGDKTVKIWGTSTGSASRLRIDVFYDDVYLQTWTHGASWK
ncbi:hypothetical protein B0J14DRAFT_658843 [Halenospora varia]|nr:hypothetical protein B0J14DRAFT_658843 [Halenospora varia]